MTITVGSDWMKHISDDLKITRLNIPGTHDSATFADSNNISPSKYWRTQDKSFDVQLNDGIRFFDIRLEQDGHDFLLCHGPVSLKISFNQVLKTFDAFLQSNPSETIFMCVKWDGYGNTSDWEKSYADNSIFYESGSFPTLGEVRGRIVLLSRMKGAKYGFSLKWPDDTVYHGAKNYNDGYKYAWTVQDNYNHEAEQSYKKIPHIQNFLKVSRNRNTGHKNTICLNFWSTVGTYFHAPYPAYSADKINNAMEKHFPELTSGEYGIQIMDFYRPDIVSQIINKNL